MPEPIACALIGIGMRARKLYLPLARAVAPWLRFAAVCSPNPQHAGEAATALGVPAFASVNELIRANTVEAALVLSSIESHHAISVALSQAGIHHLIETSMCSLLGQAHAMVAAAEANGVTLLVAENFFRFPFDRLAKQVVQSGTIGPVHRIACHQDQPGFHGHARWIKFFDAHPTAVQAIGHTMPTARHVETERRIHESEAYRAVFMHFPGARLALDTSGNSKGLLGRAARPGYAEIDGERGAIVRAVEGNLGGRAELRVCSDTALARDGKADFTAPFVDVIEDGAWLSSSVALPGGGRTEWTNAHRPGRIAGDRLREWDGAAVMQILVQFAEQVRGVRPAEFSAADAVATTEVEAAVRESLLRDGARIALPLGSAELESGHLATAALRRKFGVDPLYGDAMMAVHYPPAA